MSRKKALFITICALLLASLVGNASATMRPAASRSIQVDVEYTGTWVAVREYGFQLYLPKNWNLLPGKNEDIVFAAEEPASGGMMWLEATPNDGFTVDGPLEWLPNTDRLENVQTLYINGVAFLYYYDAEATVWGFVTLSVDGSRILFFKGTSSSNQELTGDKPIDEPLVSFVEQIMSTLSPIENRTYNAKEPMTTPTAASSPTAEPTPTPTDEPTPTPTVEPTPTPTDEPTPTPTDEPAPTPTDEPTPTPTDEPTPTPTDEPTPTPTDEPAPTPTVDSTPTLLSDLGSNPMAKVFGWAELI